MACIYVISRGEITYGRTPPGLGGRAKSPDALGQSVGRGGYYNGEEAMGQVPELGKELQTMFTS